MNAAFTASETPVPTGARGPVLAFEPTARRSARPWLECSIEPALNPNVEAAHEHTLGWAVEMGLVRPDGGKLERLRKARFTWLAARAYPTVRALELDLISDWICFLFFYDDVCDTPKVAEADYTARLIAIEDRLISIVRGAPVQRDDGALVRALADIRDRAIWLEAEAWVPRLGDHLQEYIEGCRWERLLRLRETQPSLATYARLRPLISAVPPCFDFAGMCIDGSRTAFADDILVRQLEAMATNHICWVNDIYGLDKELRERTTSNIVIVLAHELELDWEDAIDQAIEMCNAELEAFMALEAELSRRLSDEGRRYVRALGSWMRGNLDWYADTMRYVGHG